VKNPKQGRGAISETVSKGRVVQTGEQGRALCPAANPVGGVRELIGFLTLLAFVQRCWRREPDSGDTISRDFASFGYPLTKSGM